MILEEVEDIKQQLLKIGADDLDSVSSAILREGSNRQDKHNGRLTDACEFLCNGIKQLVDVGIIKNTDGLYDFINVKSKRL